MKRSDIIDKFLEAALDLFSKNYYDEISLNQILKYCNSGKASFYNSYENKMDLYSKVVTHISNIELEIYIEQKFQEKNMDLFDFIEGSIKVAKQLSKRDIRYVKFYMKFLTEKNEEIKEFVYKKNEEGIREFIKVSTKELQEENRIRKDIPIEDIIDFIYTIFVETSNKLYSFDENNNLVVNNSYLELLKTSIGYIEKEDKND